MTHLDDPTLLGLALHLSPETDHPPLRADRDLSHETANPRLDDPGLSPETAHPHLAACPRCRAALADTREAIHLLALGEAPCAPSPSLRVRLLAAVAGPVVQRSARVADLLELPPGDINAALASVDAGTAPWTPVLPGVDLYRLAAGPRERGLIRAAAGAIFPYHRHLGDEHVVVLQGSCRDGDRQLGPGDEVRHAAGTAHHLEIHPGPALVFAYVSDGSDFTALPA